VHEGHQHGASPAPCTCYPYTACLQVMAGLHENLHNVHFLDVHMRKTSELLDSLAQADTLIGWVGCARSLHTPGSPWHSGGSRRTDRADVLHVQPCAHSRRPRLVDAKACARIWKLLAGPEVRGLLACGLICVWTMH